MSEAGSDAATSPDPGGTGPGTEKRRLAAVLSADVAGYSRLMEAHEADTVAALEASRAVFRERVAARGGRIVDTSGDSVLATFDSAVEAVRGAAEIQDALAARNASTPDERAMWFRIGINLGDILEKGDGTVYGDGVNIAARLQGLAEPGGICVSGSIRDMSAARLEQAYEDLGEQAVKNISAPVRAFRLGASRAPGAGAAAAAGTGAPERRRDARRDTRPSIVVLPFENAAGVAEDDYFADGIAEDVITELSRFRSLVVIARNSAFAHKGSGQAPVDLARDLGGRYLVHGSIRKAPSRVRVTVSLIEVDSRAELWAQRYDRQLDDVFGIEDEIAGQIVSVLPSRIEAADLNRIQTQPTENLAAYEFLLKGKFHHHRSTREDNVVALEMLERATALDPGYAQAYAWKACTLAQAMVRGWAEESAVGRDIVGSLRTALSLDEDDFETHRVLSGVHLVQRDFDRAAYHAARAFELNPNDPRAMSQYGEILTALGRAEDAIIVLEQALAVDPYQPDRRLGHLANAEFVARRYADALDTLRRIAALDLHHHASFAACFARLGDGEAAARHAAEVRRAAPEFDPSDYVGELPYAQDADRAHHLEALRAAGL